MRFFWRHPSFLIGFQRNTQYFNYSKFRPKNIETICTRPHLRQDETSAVPELGAADALCPNLSYFNVSFFPVPPELEELPTLPLPANSAELLSK